MSKYDATYFMGDNQAINRVGIGSSRMSNQVTFSGSFAALLVTECTSRLPATQLGTTNPQVLVAQ